MKFQLQVRTRIRSPFAADGSNPLGAPSPGDPATGLTFVIAKWVGWVVMKSGNRIASFRIFLHQRGHTIGQRLLLLSPVIVATVVRRQSKVGRWAGGRMRWGRGRAWSCGFLFMANANAIELWRQFGHFTVSLQLKGPDNWFLAR